MNKKPTLLYLVTFNTPPHYTNILVQLMYVLVRICAIIKLDFKSYELPILF